MFNFREDWFSNVIVFYSVLYIEQYVNHPGFLFCGIGHVHQDLDPLNCPSILMLQYIFCQHYLKKLNLCLLNIINDHD